MKLFKLAPEQWTLVVVFLLIAGGAGFFGYSLYINPPQSVNDPGMTVQPKPPENYTKVQEAFAGDTVLAPAEHRVFISRYIAFYPSKSKADVFRITDPGPGGIPFKWYMDHDLPFDQAGIDQVDSDNDGFENKAEYEGKTSPVDQADHPPVLGRLVLTNIDFNQFRIMFMGYSPSGDDFVYQLNLMDAKTRKSRLVRKGQIIEAPGIGRFEVGTFTKKEEQRTDPSTGETYMEDVSELELINLNITHRKDVTALILREAVDSGDSKVSFALTVPHIQPEPATVSRGDTFKVKDHILRLEKVDVKAEKAFVIELKDDKPMGEVIEVEKGEAPTPPGSGQPGSEGEEEEAPEDSS